MPFDPEVDPLQYADVEPERTRVVNLAAIKAILALAGPHLQAVRLLHNLTETNEDGTPRYFKVVSIDVIIGGGRGKVTLEPMHNKEHGPIVRGALIGLLEALRTEMEGAILSYAGADSLDDLPGFDYDPDEEE
jgi:hypothetical protein